MICVGRARWLSRHSGRYCVCVRLRIGPFLLLIDKGSHL